MTTTLNQALRPVDLALGLAMASCSTLAADGAQAPAAPVTSLPTLFLIGGGAPFCSSVSRDQCLKVPAEKEVRSAARYGFDAAGSARFLSAPLRLWEQRPDLRQPLTSLLQAATQARLPPLDAHAARAALADLDGGAPLLDALLDAEQDALLMAFEQPQTTAGQRLREQVNLDQSRNPHSATLLRRFVQLAGEGSKRRPRVLVVTAASYDPFEAVDAYLAAFEQAGAEARWWPLDVALRSAVFERADCAQLPAARARLLNLIDRERLYPDLAGAQETLCRNPAHLLAMIESTDAVFFTGGDQSRILAALHLADGTASVWQQRLSARHARGDLLIGGTSAGTAVQSGGAMMAGGETRAALLHGGRQLAAPAEGCERAARCPPGVAEATLSYAAQGLGSLPGVTLDTHFSERARAPRLMRLLLDTGTPLGLGVDEASALEVQRLADGRLRLRAHGAHGAWLIDTRAARAQTDDARWRAEGLRLAYLGAGEAREWPASAMTMPSQDAALGQMPDLFGNGVMREQLRRFLGGPLAVTSFEQEFGCSRLRWTLQTAPAATALSSLQATTACDCGR